MTAWLVCQHGNPPMVLGHLVAKVKPDAKGWDEIETPDGKLIPVLVDEGYRKLWVRRRHVPMVMKLEGFKP